MIACKLESGKDVLLRHAVVHCLVIKENKILLVKRSEEIIEGGKWAFPGGFVNRDENARESVTRELKEETGWDGEIIGLFRINSNPKRPNDDKRQNIALEFLVKPISQSGKPDWEQTKVEWFDINEIDLESLAFDQGKTLKHLKNYLKNGVKIPIVE